jgi:hypothetical protein
LAEPPDGWALLGKTEESSCPSIPTAAGATPTISLVVKR